MRIPAIVAFERLSEPLASTRVFAGRMFRSIAFGALMVVLTLWIGMALVTAASTPQLRGRVMSFNSAVQNLFTGLAAVIGGAMLSHTAGGSLAGFEAVGLLSCLFALASLWTAFKIRTVS